MTIGERAGKLSGWVSFWAGVKPGGPELTEKITQALREERKAALGEAVGALDKQTAHAFAEPNRSKEWGIWSHARAIVSALKDTPEETK